MREEKKKNLHEHHRVRVKERFLSDGFEHFAPHEVLELLLFYALPQKDTNELAHRLIERFGSLSRVLHAEKEELCAVEGIGEHAATLLRMVMPLAAYVMEGDAREENKKFSTVTRIGRYFISRYIGQQNETVYLLLLDNRYNMIDCVRVHEGSVNSVSITPRKLIEIALRRGAAMAVLAHNHPKGIAIPSGDDLSTTTALLQAFSAVGVPLVEHILVAGEDYTPLLLHSKQAPAHQTQWQAFYADYTLEKGENESL